MQTLPLHNAHLWQARRDPYLYSVKVCLLRNKQSVDEMTQPLGVRTVGFGQEGFLLNGTPYPVYGVCRHQDLKDHGWALSPTDDARDLKLILDMGTTAVRLAHYPQNENIHTLSDKAGLLLWNEVPFVNDVPDANEPIDTPSADTLAFNATLDREMREMILQRYNHPSVAWWGLYNEIRPGITSRSALAEVKHLNDIAHQLDSTRPTVAASDRLNNPTNFVSDRMAYNVYPGWYNGNGDMGEMTTIIDERFAEQKQQKIALSEYGAGGNPAQHQESPLTKPQANNGPVHPEEWQSLMHEHNWAQMQNNPKLWGSFVWVMFDFSSDGRNEGGIPGINDKGLVTQDRSVTKDAYHFYRANWSTTPMVYITSRRSTPRRVPNTEVKIYSNTPSVELRVNGHSLGSVTPDAQHIARWPGITLTIGRNQIEAIAGPAGHQITDTCEWLLEPAPISLTPKAAATPRINGPKIFGVRPGSPFLYSIPATGDRPMTYAVDNLPTGLQLDASTGRITGAVKMPGEYAVIFRAKNALGAAEKPFRIVVGEEISLTPAMGWNSYNCFGERVTQDLALRAAHQLVALGLTQHGWTYINMDDGWQGKRGGPANALQADTERFTSVKALVDGIHALGLKAGLYSSPWTVTYGNRLGGSSESPEGSWPANADLKAKKNQKALPFAIGKYRFTYPDAQQFANWGFDYLKLDWGPVEFPETKEMHQALRITGRDIVLSLSNNHVKNLLPIIGEVAPWAQSWRTTTDIRDVWSRVANDIGFSQEKWAAAARPGHFNDADMLVVGQIGGWTPNNLHPSKLTPDEQYTHISLWCLIASPLLIGCDLEKMDDFTLGLLTNDEVLEINQDSLGKQATQIAGKGDLKVYAKLLDDDSFAVGLFNTGTETTTVSVAWSDLKLTGPQRIRDLWRQKDIGVSETGYETPVAPHGVMLVRVFPAK